MRAPAFPRTDPRGRPPRVPAGGAAPDSTHGRIFAVIARIPRGRVATYGQVARLAGLPGQARLVGYALSALGDGSRVPWHRVVNAKGLISARSDGRPEALIQRRLLKSERVAFDKLGRIPLERFRWRPKLRSPRAATP